MNVSMKDLLEAGVHFGHQVRRWNPKMRPYIYGARDGVHVLDLAKTVVKLEEALDFVRQIGQEGKTIIFVGTKKQAQAIVEEEAKRCEALYITHRWIGGLLTNWEQVQKNIIKMKDLKEKLSSGYFTDRTKKELLLMERELAKLEGFYGGIGSLNAAPGALFIIDCKKEENAVHEACKMGVPIVAICDTNCDPEVLDFAIPGNDDAVKSIRLLTQAVADAYLEGRQMGQKNPSTDSTSLLQASSGQEGKDQDKRKETSKKKKVKATSAKAAKVKNGKKIVKKSKNK